MKYILPFFTDHLAEHDFIRDNKCYLECVLIKFFRQTPIQEFKCKVPTIMSCAAVVFYVWISSGGRGVVFLFSFLFLNRARATVLEYYYMSEVT